MRTVLTAMLCAAALVAGTVRAQDPPDRRDEGREMRTYACPKHPEMRATWPGRCPKCGEPLRERRSGERGPGREVASGPTRVRPSMSGPYYSPETLLRARQRLGLSDRQVRQLREIELEARRRALSVLTDSQMARLRVYARAQAQGAWRSRLADHERDALRDQYRDRYRDAYRDGARDWDRDWRRDQRRDGQRPDGWSASPGDPPGGPSVGRDAPSYRGQPYGRPQDPGFGDSGFGDEGFGQGSGDEGFGSEGFGGDGFGDEGFGEGFGGEGFGSEGFGGEGFGNEGFGGEGFGNEGFGEGFGNEGFGNEVFGRSEGFGNEGFGREGLGGGIGMGGGRGFGGEGRGR